MPGISFEFTPEEAQEVALGFKAASLRNRVVKVENSPWDDAPYRPTFHYVSANEAVLFEVQGTFHLHDTLIGFARWIRSERKSARLYVVIDEEQHVRAGDLGKLKQLGIGLLVGVNGAFSETSAASNPVFLVDFDESWRLRGLKSFVRQHFTRFNEGDKLGAFRDICERFEFLIFDLLKKASSCGYFNPTLTAAQIEAMDLNAAICKLGSPNNLARGHNAIVSPIQLTDLHSFRGARNLADHPVRNAREAIQREQQLKERMLAAARLFVLLGDLKASVR